MLNVAKLWNPRENVHMLNLKLFRSVFLLLKRLSKRLREWIAQPRASEHEAFKWREKLQQPTCVTRYGVTPCCRTVFDENYWGWGKVCKRDRLSNFVVVFERNTDAENWKRASLPVSAARKRWIFHAIPCCRACSHRTVHEPDTTLKWSSLNRTATVKACKTTPEPEGNSKIHVTAAEPGGSLTIRSSMQAAKVMYIATIVGLCTRFMWPSSNQLGKEKNSSAPRVWCSVLLCVWQQQIHHTRARIWFV